MKKKDIFSLLISVIIFGAVIGLSLYFFNQKEPVYLQGQVESKQINVAPKVPGRVKKIYVQEGENVKEGQLLLELESTEIDAKMAQAQAAKAAATAQSNKAQNGARAEQIQGAYNLWQQAKVASELAEKTYERVSNLFKDKVIPEQKKDEAYTKMQAMKKQERAAYSQYQMAKNGARIEDKEAASALVAKAEGAISEVQAYKEGAKVYAPAAAEIQEIIPNQGEIVNAGYPVINLIDTNDTWVIFNIREDKLNNYKVGNKFTATVPALGNKSIELVVNHIAAQGDFATWNATKANGDFDRKTFEVKARPTTPIKDLKPGMSVLVEEIE